MAWSVSMAVLLIVAALRAATGNLAEVAFYEAIRRAVTPAATWSFTMKDLPPVSEPPAQVPEPPAKPLEPPAQVPEPPAKPLEPPAKFPELPDESSWRARMNAARTALDRDEVLAEAMQGRVNGLTSESIGRDDPAQRAELLKQRGRALAELDRLALQIEKDKLAIAAIEEDARKKGIPPGWIR